MVKNKKTIQFIGVDCILMVILTLLDQWTKSLVVHHLKDQSDIILIPGIFRLHYLENRGAAFGILQGKKIFFVVFTLIVLCLIAYLYLKRIPDEKKFRPMDGICILFFAGALGNFIDRVFRNYVVDFFYFKLIDFPVFNVADIYVTVGTFILVFAIKGMANVPELTDGLGKFIVFGIIVSIGMSLGGLTGYAINPARDLGPRLAHAVLPIKGKGSSNWGYGIVTLIGPVIGAVAAVLLFGAIPW